MQNRSSHFGRVTACLCAALLAVAPAAAQDWHNGQDRSRDWSGRDAFERGYRDGRAAERREFSAGLAWNNAQQGEAYERLERAASDLRRALVLMQRAPSLPRVNAALVQAREALESTQNAMTWLPPGIGPDRRGHYERRSGRSIGAERASGGWES